MAISALVLDQSSHRPALFLRSLDLEGYYTSGAFLPVYTWMVESLLLVLRQKPQGISWQTLAEFCEAFSFLLLWGVRCTLCQLRYQQEAESNSGNSKDYNERGTGSHCFAQLWYAWSSMINKFQLFQLSNTSPPTRWLKFQLHLYMNYEQLYKAAVAKV